MIIYLYKFIDKLFLPLGKNTKLRLLLSMSAHQQHQHQNSIGN